MRRGRVPRRPLEGHGERAPRDLPHVPRVAIALPRLVIVSGPPAAGKTTLARELSRATRLPLITKDRIKERLADLEPPADREASRRLGVRTYEILYRTAAALLAQGAGCVLESNFAPGRSEARLRPLATISRAALVLCEASPDVLVARYRARIAGGGRHPAHFDAAVLEEWDRLGLPDHGPLDLDVPLLRVDTTAGLRPQLADIIAFVLASTEDS